MKKTQAPNCRCGGKADDHFPELAGMSCAHCSRCKMYRPIKVKKAA